MSDEVGVSPGRLNELASKLEHLRDVLAANVPVIVNTLNVYWSGGTGAPVSLAPLQQAGARSVDDAANMRSRSNLAQAFMAQGGDIFVVPGALAYIPWDTKDVDAADAKLQAQLLAEAQKSGDKATIRSVERDIADHKADAEWLAEFWKLEHQADYEAGVQLAKTLKETIGNDGNYQHALAALAQHAGNPYFIAGLLNNLDVEQFVYLMILSQTKPGLLPPTKTDQAIATAMAAGTLSPKIMHEMAMWLTSPNANASGNQFLTDPLLQEIANNPKASAYLISFINLNPQASGSTTLKAFLKLYAHSGAENSVLKIMANAVSAAPSQPPMAMIKSMVNDLSVLDSATISQSDDGVAAFMSAAAVRLVPAIGPNGPDFPGWYLAYRANLEQGLAPLLRSIGQAFQGHEESVRFWRGYFEGIVTGAALAAIPLDGVPEAGVIAVGAGAPAIVPFTPTQRELDWAAAHLFPDTADGGTAVASFNEQLERLVLTGGVVHIYTAAGHGAEAQAILNDPEFYRVVDTFLAGGNPGRDELAWCSRYVVRLPGQTESIGNVIEGLVSSSAALVVPPDHV